MNNSLSTQVCLKQQISLTQKMMDELKILQMSDLELKQYVDIQIQQNPFLEIAESEAEDSEEIYDDFEDKDYDDNENDDVTKGDMKNDFTQYTQKLVSLKDHLVSQLGEIKLNNEIHAVASYVIENINDDGYLISSIEDIARELNMPILTIKRALKVVQSFEPAGVGARSLKECILLQLSREGLITPNIKKVVKEFLEQLALRKYNEITIKCGIDKEEVILIHEAIKNTDPKPGCSISCSITDNIRPELYLNEKHGNPTVEYFNESDFKIRISSYYKKLYQESSGDVKTFLKTSFSNASRIIEGIERRKATIINVASYIVNHQSEFFTKGRTYIKPLTMKEAGEALGLHESTISRTVNNKYIQTSMGIFELKHFFSAKIYNDATANASEAIKSMVFSIIKDEDKSEPYSDAEIEKILQIKGFSISRRTVAKYRKELSILPAKLRKNV